MSITGVDEATPIQKLEERRGNLNEVVNAHCSEGDGSLTQHSFFISAGGDVMDIDDPTPVPSHRTPFSLLPFSRDLNPFSLLDPNYTSGGASTRSPFVSHPKEVREIPIEVKDESGASVGASIIEDVTEATHELGPEVRGAVIIDDEDDDKDILTSPVTHIGRGTGGSSTNSGPNATTILDLPDYGNDIGEQMIRAAIETSKQDVTMSNQEVRDSAPQPIQAHGEDDELEHAVSLSLQSKKRRSRK